MADITGLCNRFADILGGKILRREYDSCQIGIDRDDIHPTLLGVPISPGHMFMIKLVAGEKALVHGEMVLLENEVPGVVHSLLEHDIIVSSEHTHWLFDRPRLMYIHLQAIMNPLEFAQKVADLLNE